MRCSVSACTSSGIDRSESEEVFEQREPGRTVAGLGVVESGADERVVISIEVVDIFVVILGSARHVKLPGSSTTTPGSAGVRGASTAAAASGRSPRARSPPRRRRRATTGRGRPRPRRRPRGRPRAMPAARRANAPRTKPARAGSVGRASPPAVPATRPGSAEGVDAAAPHPHQRAVAVPEATRRPGAATIPPRRSWLSVPATGRPRRRGPRTCEGRRSVSPHVSNPDATTRSRVPRPSSSVARIASTAACIFSSGSSTRAPRSSADQPAPFDVGDSRQPRDGDRTHGDGGISRRCGDSRPRAVRDREEHGNLEITAPRRHRFEAARVGATVDDHVAHADRAPPPPNATVRPAARSGPVRRSAASSLRSRPSRCGSRARAHDPRDAPPRPGTRSRDRRRRTAPPRAPPRSRSTRLLRRVHADAARSRVRGRDEWCGPLRQPEERFQIRRRRRSTSRSRCPRSRAAEGRPANADPTTPSPKVPSGIAFRGGAVIRQRMPWSSGFARGP